MIAFERYKKANYILGEIESYKTLRNAARTLSETLFDKGATFNKSLTGDQNSRNACLAELQRWLNEVPGIVKSISHRTIYREIDQLEELLEQIFAEENDSSGVILATKEALAEFALVYEKIISGYHAAHSVELVYAAQIFSSRLEVLLASYLAIRDGFGLDENLSKSDSKAELSVYLSTINSVEDFASKLHAISELYNELARILDVDVGDYPLEIANIESGSLWSRLFGDSKVIQLIVDLLRGGAGYLHRTYTVEGKVSAIPESLDSLNKVLDFSKRLEGEGLDVSAIREELRIAGVGIARNLNTLLEKQYKVEINGEEQSLQDAAMKAISKEKWMETLRISHDEGE